MDIVLCWLTYLIDREIGTDSGDLTVGFGTLTDDTASRADGVTFRRTGASDRRAVVIVGTTTGDWDRIHVNASTSRKYIVLNNSEWKYLIWIRQFSLH